MICVCHTCGRVEPDQIIFWNKCEQCQRIDYLEKQTAAQAAELERLREVETAARIIFDVSAKAGIRTKQIECPHGNIPDYPTHAWWCDKCFGRLDDALDAARAGGEG